MKKVILLLIGIFIFSACEEKNQEETITIGFVTWEENIALAHLAKLTLEKEGFSVKFRHADVDPIFSRLLPKKKIDVFMDAWFPTTHQEYIEKYKDHFDIVGTNFKNAKTGLVVPDYVDINSITERNKNRNQFKYKITGIDIGAGIMLSTEKAIQAYDLDFELIPSTNFAMKTALRKAIEKKEWIVITGWTPNSIFAEHDLKFLEDPENIFGESEEIKTIVRKDFTKAVKILEKIQLHNKQMSALLKDIKEAKHEFEGAEKWAEENKILIEKWLSTSSN